MGASMLSTFDFSDTNSWLTLGTSIALAIAILVVGWMVSKTAERMALSGLRRRLGNEALARFAGQMIRYLVLAVAVVAALGKVGVETTSAVAMLGAAGFAVGMALQGNLSNFASGVMILFFKPFQLDDRITAAGHTGAVLDIGLFVTTLSTAFGERIILGNSAVLAGPIINLTNGGPMRGTVAVGAFYGADVAKVKEVLDQATTSVDVVLSEPAAGSALVGLGASSIDFEVQYWTEPSDYLAGQHGVRTAVYDALNAAGIDIPFSQIVVHKADAA